jgi:hypothetical protein
MQLGLHRLIGLGIMERQLELADAVDVRQPLADCAVDERISGTGSGNASRQPPDQAAAERSTSSDIAGKDMLGRSL